MSVSPLPITIQRLSALHLALLVFGRFTFNTAFRLVYPLLTFIADGFSINLQTASLLVTVQVGATLLSPLGGTLADRQGERATMLWGAGLFIIGTLLAAAAQDFGWFLAGYSVIGVATALYMPAMQTYASERSHYTQRARVLGILEFSWAFAALFGVASLSAVVDATQRWTIPFTILAAAGALTLALTLRLPNDRQPAAAVPAHTGRRSGLRTWLAPLATADARNALLFSIVALFAVELIFVSYSGWLSRDFQLTTQQLGLIFGSLGIVELAGSVAATLFTDRIGKRRAVLVGFAAVGIVLAVLPFSQPNLAIFLIGLLIFDLCFEFAIVSFFPLVSGLTTQGRGVLLAVMVAAIGVARIAASLSGPWIVEWIGYAGNSWIAGALSIAAVIFGLRRLREGQH